MMKRFIVKINAEFALFTWSCLSAVFYNKSKVINTKEAQQGNYKAFSALEQKVEWMDTPETVTTTGAPAVLEILKKKTNENFPRRSCN